MDGILREPDEEQKAKPPELEFVTFAERETLLRRGREAGLPPTEFQLLKLLAANPRISDPEAACELPERPPTW